MARPGPVLLSLASLLAVLPATAQTLPEVRVEATSEKESAAAPVSGYKARNAVSATKTDTPLIETPQAVTVITRDQIVDQGATGVQDALNYAAGVRSNAYGLDSRSDNVRIRGSTPDTYQDGLRRMFDWYTSDTRTEPFTLERIEVLRGPASMLFGQGSTGGVINMVSKLPQAQQQGEIGVQLGSFNRKQLQADLTGPLTADGQWLYRLIAVGRESDTQVDYVPDDRRLLAPSLTWRPSGVTSLTLQALWQKDHSGSTSQFLPWEGTLLSNPNGQIPTSRFIGEPGFDRYDSERKSFGWLFEHHLDEHWTVRQNLRYSQNDVDYFTLYGDSFTLPGGWAEDPVNQRILGRYVDATSTRAKMLAADQHVQGDFATGSVQHKLLAGVDVARYRKETKSFFDAPAALGGTAPSIDVYNPVYTGYSLPGELQENPESGVRQAGVYLQDQLRVGNWIVVAGLRHDRATTTVEGTPDADTSATTKRLGVLYAFPSGWSPYLSYSESFTPNAPVSRFGEVIRLEPLRGEQWEAGLKYEPAGSRFAGSVAVYRLKEKNQVLDDGVSISQAGTTHTDGVELEFKGRVTTALDVVAHYNYTNVDPTLEQLPEHQAAVWGRYRFALGGVTGFSAGAGVRWMSAFRDGAAPTTPAVTLLDLMLGYEAGHWRYALNVQNATDKRYVSTCLSRGDCWYGARRNALATATYVF
jgi:iron complex outermembrane receptor protein